MFLLLLVCAVIGYGFNNVLMAGLFRRHPLLDLVALRGLALLVLMAPLLVLVDTADWRALPGLLPALLIACAAATVANLAQAQAVRHLPVGIAYAGCMVASTICTAAAGLILYAERPGAAALAMGAVVVLLTVVLALDRRSSVDLPAARPLRGWLASLGFGLSMATALAALFQVARGSSPFLAAWAWEAGIGIMALLCVWLARLGGRPSVLLQGGLWWRTAGAAAPTVVGTGCYAWAISLGELSIAAAVLTTVMVASAVIARAIYGERLSLRQWWLIAATCGALVGLELVRN